MDSLFPHRWTLFVLHWMPWGLRTSKSWLPRRVGRTKETAMKSEQALRTPRLTMETWLPTFGQWWGPHWCRGNQSTHIYLLSTMRTWNPDQLPKDPSGFTNPPISPWLMTLASQRVAARPRWENRDDYFSTAIIFIVLIIGSESYLCLFFSPRLRPVPQRRRHQRRHQQWHHRRSQRKHLCVFQRKTLQMPNCRQVWIMLVHMA